MTARSSKPRSSSRCASGAKCFLQNYKHLNPEVKPGQHSSPEEAERCERKAGVWNPPS